MDRLMEIWKRISNWKSLMGIASALLIISNTLNLGVDQEVAQTIIEAVLTILVILGIINKSGMETSKWNK